MDTYRVEDTPFGYTLSVIGGKWKMVIMFVLVEHDVMRYSELKRAIPVSYTHLDVYKRQGRDTGAEHFAAGDGSAARGDHVFSAAGRSICPV